MEYLFVILACILLLIIATLYRTIMNIYRSKGNFRIVVSIVNAMLYGFMIFLVMFYRTDQENIRRDSELYDRHQSGFIFMNITYKETKENFHILEVHAPFSDDLIAVTTDGIDIPPITELLAKNSPFEPKIIVYCNQGADWYREKGFIKIGSSQCYYVDGVVKITPDYSGLLIDSGILTSIVIFVFNGICFQILKEKQKQAQQEEQTP